jgi:drug/metabolite transporter (DMT)-like permease
MASPASTPRNDLLVALSPAAFVFLWSTGFLGVKLGLPHAAPFSFLAVRFAITATVILVFALAVRAAWPRGPALAMHAMAAGALLHATYIGGVTGAIANGVPAGVVALVAGLQPLVTAALAGRVLGETVTRRQWAGLGLGFAGVLMVVYAKLSIGEATPVGFVFTVMALAGVTAGTLYQKRFCGGLDMRAGLAIQFVTASALCFAAGALVEDFRIDWTGEFVFAVLWLALVVSCGAFTLLMLMLRRGAAAKVTSLFYLTPPSTALLGWLIFGETMGALALAGMAVAVAGVALASR